MPAAWSEGIPRKINNLCFNALSLGYAKRQRSIDASIVQEAVRDLSLDSLGSERLTNQNEARDSEVNITLPEYTGRGRVQCNFF